MSLANNSFCAQLWIVPPVCISCFMLEAVLRIRITFIRIRIQLFTLMRIRIRLLPFNLMRIRLLHFNSVLVQILPVPLTFFQIWTLQCSKMTLSEASTFSLWCGSGSGFTLCWVFGPSFPKWCGSGSAALAGGQMAQPTLGKGEGGGVNIIGRPGGGGSYYLVCPENGGCAGLVPAGEVVLHLLPQVGGELTQPALHRLHQLVYRPTVLQDCI
jgi:hypothetical protein